MGLALRSPNLWQQPGATIVFNNLTQESVDEGLKIIKQPASKPMAMSVMSPMKQQSMKWSKP